MIPSAHTILSAEALCRYAEREFAIGAVERGQLWRTFVNDVYRLSAQGKYYWLRIHPFGWRTPSETEAEIDALLAVSAAGGMLALPVARRNGGYLARISAPEGVRTGVLFHDAPGCDLQFSGPAGPTNARRYGEAVGRLHLACDAVQALPQRARIDLNLCVSRPAQMLLAHLDEPDRTALETATDRLAATLQAFTSLSCGFCHGDLNSSNIQFSSTVAVAIDFDCCGWGWRAFEVAAFARGITWFRTPGADSDALIRSFFEGYFRHKTLARQDIEAQPAMLLAQRLWVTALHLQNAGRWGASHYGPAYTSSFMRWLQTWQDWRMRD
jgi:Ser/Thr protein kinase RdoA (MazF antagonist)